MPKGIWISVYKSVKNPDALAEYAKLAGDAIEKAGVKILARGLPAVVFEAGIVQRTVVLEFPSVDAAAKFYQSPPYQRALKALGDAVEREIRIIEGSE